MHCVCSSDRCMPVKTVQTMAIVFGHRSRPDSVSAASKWIYFTDFLCWPFVTWLRIFVYISHSCLMYMSMCEEEREKRRWRFGVHYACLPWNKNKYRDHKYQHSGGEVPMKMRFFFSEKGERIKPRPLRHSIGSIRVFIGLCIETNEHTRMHGCASACLRSLHTHEPMNLNTRFCSISVVSKHSNRFQLLSFSIHALCPLCYYCLCVLAS